MDLVYLIFGLGFFILTALLVGVFESLRRRG